MKPSVQSRFLNKLRRDKIPVTMFLMNGFQMKGAISAFDDFSVILNTTQGNQMVYKHAISTISPSQNVELPVDEQPAAPDESSEAEK